ncbi:MAG TPA: oligopeptide ABC transporter permease [Acidimicrobiia bacterium]|nr:oligopeptide ABC transporter permease [Acidimicrobiia bacterium]
MIRQDGPGDGLDVDAIVEASIATGGETIDDLSVDEVAARPPRSPFKVAMRRFMKHRLALISLIFLVLLGLVAVLAPLVAPADPNAVDLRSLRAPPSPGHILGTDSAGRDVLSRLIFGARVSLTVGVAAAISAAGIGTILGLTAGFTRGWVDTVIMRVVDIFLSFPSLIVILLLVAILGPSVTTIVVVIALFEWPTSCRIVRQMTLALREHDFVLAARASGSSNFRIMRRHILSGVTSPLTVVATLLSAQAILLEAALSFLGLGVRPPQASWGGMLNEAQSITVLAGLPWLWLPPGIAIASTVLAINFVGDGLRDAFDPRQTR